LVLISVLICRPAASDACALPVKAQSFDLIVPISTLDHLPPDLLPGGLAELCRVLRPGGGLILTLDSRQLGGCLRPGPS